MIKKMLLGICIFTLTIQSVNAQTETPVSEEEVEKLKASEEDLWYTDLPLPEETKTTDPEKNTTVPAWITLVFKAIMWAVIAAILGYIVYVIVQQIRLNKSAVNEVIDDDIEIESAEKLSQIDFKKSIQQTLEKENYRLAIRFYYLWLVQQLSDDGLIIFTKDKTNQTYVRELTKNQRVSDEVGTSFKTCTRLYEYVWFGNFAVDKSRFEEIEPQFSFILNQPTG
ncbi:MAG: hypothetical protein ACI9V1_001029 [Spirosomataceae bacterium]|jgi:hypothetical protein